jgi:hypothetical protein
MKKKFLGVALGLCLGSSAAYGDLACEEALPSEGNDPIKVHLYQTDGDDGDEQNLYEIPSIGVIKYNGVSYSLKGKYTEQWSRGPMLHSYSLVGEGIEVGMTWYKSFHLPNCEMTRAGCKPFPIDKFEPKTLTLSIDGVSSSFGVNCEKIHF